MRSKLSSAGRKPAAHFALAVSILFNIAAFLLLRAVTGSISSNSGEISASILFRAMANRLFWAGGVSFTAGLYFWIQSLKVIPLSKAYPTAAISYIIMALLSWYLFDEPVTLSRVIGMVIIIAGVAMLHRRETEGST